MKKIYLVRHGETDYNKNGLLQGIIDIPLNDTGIEQAKKAGEFLKDKKIQAFYSSYLTRAKNTAEYSAKHYDLNVIIYPNLHEVDLGILSGNDKAFAETTIPNYAIIKQDKNIDIVFPEGATKFNERKRIFDTITKLCQEDNNNTICIASHGFILRELLNACDFIDNYSINNCEIIEAEFDKNTNNITIIKRIIV